MSDSPRNPLLFGSEARPRETVLTTELTLRDLFAAATLAGVVGNWEGKQSLEEERRRMSCDCYAMADAMLKARGK